MDTTFDLDFVCIKDAETMRERNRLRQARHRVTKKRDKSVTVTLGHAASRYVTPNKNENESKKENEIENREVIPHRRAAPAHTRIFMEEASKNGVTVVVTTPDAIQLAAAYKACGSEDTFRSVCERWFQSDDEYVKNKWGYAGQYINKKLQALLNAGAVSETAFQKTTTSGGKYADTPILKGL